MQPEERIRGLLEAGEVLGDRVRPAIMLYLIIRGTARFKELADGLALSSGNLAHHLEILQQAGYLEVKRTFEDLRARLVSPTSIGVAALRNFLSKLAEFQVR